jgi:hypothetical protein
MKKKTNFLIYSFVIMSTFLIFTSACKKKQPELNSKISELIKTKAVSSITIYAAKSGGNINNDLKEKVIARGICWSKKENPTVSVSGINTTTDGTGKGDFDSILVGLSPNTTYYVRAYAKTASGIIYGNIASFVTTKTSS